MADYIALLLAEIDSVKTSLNMFKEFSLCAGLKINVEKIKKYIGTLARCAHLHHGLSRIKTPIETLGIVITDNNDNNYKHNFQQRIINLKAIRNIWKQRKLSLKDFFFKNNLALAPIDRLQWKNNL